MISYEVEIMDEEGEEIDDFSVKCEVKLKRYAETLMFDYPEAAKILISADDKQYHVFRAVKITEIGGQKLLEKS